MRKTNLLKGLVCGLLFTAVAGSAVMAGTGKDEYFIGTGTQKDNIVSNVGNYCFNADEDCFDVSAVSTHSTSKKFYVVASYTSYQNDKVQYLCTNTKVMTKGDKVACSILRDKRDPFSECHGRAVTWYGEQDYTGIRDDYTVIYNQRCKEK